jgi:hypothetical protein
MLHSSFDCFLLVPCRRHRKEEWTWEAKSVRPLTKALLATAEATAPALRQRLVLLLWGTMLQSLEEERDLRLRQLPSGPVGDERTCGVWTLWCMLPQKGPEVLPVGCRPATHCVAPVSACSVFASIVVGGCCLAGHEDVAWLVKVRRVDGTLRTFGLVLSW